jgi:hypothetical protein
VSTFPATCAPLRIFNAGATAAASAIAPFTSTLGLPDDVTIDLNAIGQMQGILNPGQPREDSQLIRTAWMYVACQRGFDCSDYGPGTVPSCGPYESNCTPIPEQFMMRAHNNWAPVQDRVNQINAALAAKQWDKLPGLTTGADD